MGKKPILKVRVYRGTELNYDADANVKNENHLISLEHKSRNWVLFLKNILLNGYCKVEVEKGFTPKGNGEYDVINDISEFKAEVKEAFDSNIEVVLTADQKRIAELEAKIELLLKKDNDKNEVSEKKEKTDDVDEELDIARAEYLEVFGKKPHHLKGVDSIKAEIEEKQKND